jgi:hypothetical protein
MIVGNQHSNRAHISSRPRGRGEGAGNGKKFLPVDPRSGIDEELKALKRFYRLDSIVDRFKFKFGGQRRDRRRRIFG